MCSQGENLENVDFATNKIGVEKSEKWKNFGLFIDN